MIDHINLLLLLLLLLLYLNRFFVRFCKKKIYMYVRPVFQLEHVWQPHPLVRACEETEREKARKWRHRLYAILFLFY